MNKESQAQGRDGEQYVRRKYEFNGYKVTRTGRGHDWKAERKDWMTGKKETKYIEVKTTKSENPRLSELQKKKKRQLGSKYVVEELEPTPLGPVSKDSVFRSSTSSKKHNTNKRSSGFDLGFGLNSNSRNSKRNSNRIDSMFGSGSSVSKRRKSSGIDSMFGSGSSRKKRNSSSWGFGL